MPAAIYTDTRLSTIYDALNPPGPDGAFYIELAGGPPKQILDMGCGTGRLACDLASKGHLVTGADPAAAMLNIARSRAGGNKVTWIKVAAADLSVETRFNLIIMTGHVFQVFLAEQEITAALRTLRSHLAQGGRLAFETRNPIVRKWDEWTLAKTRKNFDIAGIGLVQFHQVTRSVVDELVTYESYFRFGDTEVAVATDTLRFISRNELASFLANAGFADVTWYGNWDRSPIGPSSPEIIAIARETADPTAI